MATIGVDCFCAARLVAHPVVISDVRSHCTLCCRDSAIFLPENSAFSSTATGCEPFEGDLFGFFVVVFVLL